MKTTLIPVRFLVIAAWLGLTSVGAWAAAELHGRITAQDTGYGIEAATVQVFAATNANVAQLTARTDGFGFFSLRDLPSGSYRFEASHAAYHPHETNTLVLADGQRQHYSAALVPLKPGAIRFDLYPFVACAKTGLELRGVPVTIDVTPQEDMDPFDETLYTDTTGSGQFVGLPRGFYRFAINSGEFRVPGWDYHIETVSHNLTGPYSVTALLKPEERTLMVSVYGFDPVTQQENAPLGGIIVEATGVSPWDPQRVLLPPQVGVSGIRKDADSYWNNAMAAKVKFTGLPPIHYLIEGKRLGYHLSTVQVTTDANAQLVPSDLRLDMQLMDTRITAVFNSPYQDPEMLVGLKARLQGMKNSNTEGIDRLGTITYQAARSRAVAVFDKILPGNYRLTVNDSVEKQVPIIVQGQDIYAGSWNGPKSFTVRFLAEDSVDAVADWNQDVEVKLQPQPMKFFGQIIMVDEETSNFEYLHYTKALSGIEIHGSEYLRDHQPTNTLFQAVNSDTNGQFVAVLMPGLYGVRVPNLDDYWGESIESIDLKTQKRAFEPWPYYQLWPYGAESAKTGVYGVGGFAVSSDDDVQAQLFIRRDHVNIDFRLIAINDDPTESQVVAISWSGSNVVYYGWNYYQLQEEPANVSLRGGTTAQQHSLGWTSGTPECRFEQVLPGNGYYFHLDHSRYALSSASANYRFDYYDHNPPGYLPTFEPPGSNYDGPHPMLPFMAQMFGDYKNPGEAKFTLKQLDSEGRYQDVATEVPPLFLKTSYTGDRLFHYGGHTPPTSYEVWLELSRYFTNHQEHWYHYVSPGGDLNGTIYLDGPARTTASIAEPLRVEYDLRIVALNARGKPNEPPINGVRVRFKDGTSAFSGSTTLAQRTESFEYDHNSVTHPNWRFSGNDEIRIRNGPMGPEVDVVLFMEQAVAIRGQVANARTNSPIPGARVNVTHAQGNVPIMGPPSRADGTFSYPYAFGRQVYFLEVDALGYKPFRLRLDPQAATPDPQDPRTLAFIFEGANAVKLEPLEPPVVLKETVSLDRFGAFLPSVKKGGNQDLLNDLVADENLTLTWRLQAQRPPDQTVQLPGYDDRNGNPAPPVTLTLLDDLKEVWLVDLRGFTNHTYADPAVPLRPPDRQVPHLFHDWLARISQRDASTPNVFHQRIIRINPTADPTISQATGQVKLWQLPPDEFKPAFVAVSRLGAVALYPFEYTGAYTNKQLVGFRMPQWMASFADALGMIAGSQVAQGDRWKELKNAFPTGRLIPMPQFTADINLRAGNYLDYSYKMDVNLNEGMNTPASGLLTTAPGILGMSLFAGVKVSLKGESKEFSIQLKEGAGQPESKPKPPGTGTPAAPESKTPVTPDRVNKEALKPAPLKGALTKVKLDPLPSGEIQHVFSEKFTTQNEINEIRVMHGVATQVGIRATASFMPIMQNIPYAGPVLLMLHRTADFDLGALVKGLIGLRTLAGWSTTFPQQIEHYTTMPVETGQYQRHFLGGYEEPVSRFTNTFDLCFNFGVGLYAKVGEHAGASGTIELSGDDCWTRNPALLCDLNSRPTWPMLRRVRGDVRAVVEAYLDAWVVKYQRKWYWKALKIDQQFGTETKFYLGEMEVLVSETSRNHYGPATFDGRRPQLVRNFYPLGTYALASGATEALAFTDVLSVGGDVGLKVTLRTGPTNWSQPRLVSQSRGAIIAAQVASQPVGGGWMAVWTEIDASHVDDFYPPSQIRYATSDATGATWTAPLTVASMDEVAANLRLVPFGSGLALVFTRTSDGPVAKNYSIHATRWDGTQWTPSQTLMESTPVSGLDAIGTPDPDRLPLQLALVDDSQKLWALSWNGVSNTVPRVIVDQAGNDISLVLGADQTQYLAWRGASEGLGLFRYEAASQSWTNQGIPFPAAQPHELRLSFLNATNGPLLLASWTEGGNHAALHYGFMTTQGTNVLGPVNLTLNTSGRYYHPDILVRDGFEASLLALFENGLNQVELRQFDVAFPGGSIGNDRDADGMNDLAELLVVDADPTDAIVTIDQVTPNDDFDKDGFSNQQEIAWNLDPADTNSFPALRMLIEPSAAITAGAQWRVAGGEWMNSGDALALRAGLYRLEFKPVNGWNTPPDQDLTVEAGVPVLLTRTFSRTGTGGFSAWVAGLNPPLPADKQSPADPNGLLQLPNIVAYALGINPLTAAWSDLPQARIENQQCIYSYRRSKTATGVGFQVLQASQLSPDQWHTTGINFVKLSETETHEFWQASWPVSAATVQLFLQLQITTEP